MLECWYKMVCNCFYTMRGLQWCVPVLPNIFNLSLKTIMWEKEVTSISGAVAYYIFSNISSAKRSFLSLGWWFAHILVAAVVRTFHIISSPLNINYLLIHAYPPMKTNNPYSSTVACKGRTLLWSALKYVVSAFWLAPASILAGKILLPRGLPQKILVITLQ